MKSLIETILQEAVKKGYEYALIEPYDRTTELERTNDVSLGFANAKNKYQGIHNYDDIIIEFWQGDDHKGNILWSNWNDNAEQVSDYHCKLDDKNNLNLDNIVKTWEKDLLKITNPNHSDAWN